jgi:hypothetical protein
MDCNLIVGHVAKLVSKHKEDFRNKKSPAIEITGLAFLIGL